jgi:quercetin dioxygenase-like cupin family protein
MKGDGKFVVVLGQRIGEVLEHSLRQYLAGNLKKPQELQHIADDRIEIGLTRYDAATVELPHWHLTQREYQYMISGRTVYQEVLTGRIHEYRRGDFFGILPEICYTQDSDPDTTILFIKHPAVDDKIVCRHCRQTDCPARIEPFSVEKEVR